MALLCGAEWGMAIWNLGFVWILEVWNLEFDVKWWT
jgi:hypothetical protein